MAIHGYLNICTYTIINISMKVSQHKAKSEIKYYIPAYMFSILFR
jgi:hypothetical protein